MQAEMMLCMAFSEYRLQLPAGKREPLLVVCDNDALFVDGQYLAKHTLHALCAIYRRRAGDQLGWIDNMPRAPRMNDALCVRQMLHRLARAARMVEMYVREEHIIDRANVDIDPLQTVEQRADTGIRASVDDRSTVAFEDQVTGIEPRPHEPGIYADNAASVSSRLCRFFRHAHSPGAGPPGVGCQFSSVVTRPDFRA